MANERVVSIVNPAAGRGIGDLALPTGEVYYTKGIGDATEYLKTLARSTTEPLRVNIVGGDGTVAEVVRGAIESGRREGLVLSVIPNGTGNDFVRSFEVGSGEHSVDAIKVGDDYAVNVANIGFDCRVVAETDRLKRLPFVSGNFAYILGVVKTLCGRISEHLRVEYTDADGKTAVIEDELLLVLAANASYYGGGFLAAPVAKTDDGLVDLIAVKKMSRLRFIKLVGRYRMGRHFGKNGRVDEKYSDVLTHVRVKHVKVSGMTLRCLDGEVREASEVEMSVVSGAVRFAF